MQHASTTPWDENGQLEVLTFDIGDERLAIEAVNIREILDLLPETWVPGAPPLVASVVNFRGKIIPIADLRVAFGMPTDSDAAVQTDHRIVVIETELDGEPLQIGLRADKVHEVAILDRADSCEPPVLGMRWRREFVRELVRNPQHVIVIPNLPTIFSTLAEAA
ncbi:chemotaxis protein CheW [Novosphingobium cyanobacteriorum]|uniref:Chemotaxis protein CheW n=1 Tax=Novosphingobium cyanobacteriorum TaxID=3024215 RepID=A0ABT6CE05_9SPHN|nr:chemotaxis protein CheW [Novosphingobium cyanobacteriorum]MDF8332151.1 chemotaxis protein CheW [Novosphingobium cyanobacteriorum]